MSEYVVNNTKSPVFKYVLNLNCKHSHGAKHFLCDSRALFNFIAHYGGNVNRIACQCIAGRDCWLLVELCWFGVTRATILMFDFVSCISILSELTIDS